MRGIMPMGRLIAGLVIAGLPGLAAAQQGPLTPVPADQFLVYVFTGVVNDTSAGDLTATLVSCTNVGPEAIDVTVELFNSAGNLAGTDTQALTPGETETWESSNAPTIAGSAVTMTTSGIFDAGSGRILASTKKALLLCTAQAIDAESTPAMHLADLPIVSVGKPPKIKPFKE